MRMLGRTADGKWTFHDNENHYASQVCDKKKKIKDGKLVIRKND